MAKKDIEKKLREMEERERKFKEEMRAMRRQLAKEEREERKRCYLEIGKAVESCLPRNFREEDVKTFSAFLLEHEHLIRDFFEAREPKEDSDAESADMGEDVPEEAQADDGGGFGEMM